MSFHRLTAAPVAFSTAFLAMAGHLPGHDGSPDGGLHLAEGALFSKRRSCYSCGCAVPDFISFHPHTTARPRHRRLSLFFRCDAAHAYSNQLVNRCTAPSVPHFFHLPEPARLRGSSAYGDAIEDEWFVVFLLRELTRALSVPVSARVWDSDGDFLMIEAAYHLPKWREMGSRD